MTDSGHELSLRIHLMIPHIDIPVRIHDSDQVSSHDILTRILTRQHISGLPIMKHRILRDLTIRGSTHWPEAFVVVVHGFS